MANVQLFMVVLLLYLPSTQSQFGVFDDLLNAFDKVVTDLVDLVTELESETIETDLHTYNAHLYHWDENTRVFPESSYIGTVDSNTIGLAISGGGLLAHVAAVGQIRALRRIGLLNTTVKYLSTASGGAWAGALYTYPLTSEFTDDDLLGRSINPDELQAADLNTVNPKNIASIALQQSSIFSELFDFLRNPSNLFSHRAWSYFVRDFVLKPFNLDSDSDNPQPFGYTQQHVNSEILPTNRNLPNANFQTVRRDVPYLIVDFALAPNPREDRFGFLYGECTPMYCGVPQFHAGTGKGGVAADIGGGWIDSFAFDSGRLHTGTLRITIVSVSGVDDDEEIRVEYSLGTGDEFSGETPQIDHDPAPVFGHTDIFVIGSNVGISSDTRLKFKVIDDNSPLPDDTKGEYSLDTRSLPVGSGSQVTLTDGGVILRVIAFWETFSSISNLTTNNRTIQTKSKSYQYALYDCLGSSSDAASAAIQIFSNDGINGGLPHFTVFPLKNLHEPRNIPTVYNIVDGGVIDNSAIMALLFRRVTKIIACIHPDNPTETVGNGLSRSVAALFGYQSKLPGFEWATFDTTPLNPHSAAQKNNQVFEGSLMFDLINCVEQAAAAGRAVYCERTYTVLPNTWWNIPGGWNVTVQWFFNHINEDWKAKLSPAGQEAFNEVSGNFPGMLIARPYNAEEINLLTNMWDYTISAVMGQTNVFGATAVSTSSTLASSPQQCGGTPSFSFASNTPAGTAIGKHPLGDGKGYTEIQNTNNNNPAAAFCQIDLTSGTVTTTTSPITAGTYNYLIQINGGTQCTIQLQVSSAGGTAGNTNTNSNNQGTGQPSTNNGGFGSSGTTVPPPASGASSLSPLVAVVCVNIVWVWLL